VCNYCFKQWEEGIEPPDNGTNAPPGLSPSPSATSLASTKSSCTCHSSSSTVGSTPYSTGPYQRVPYTSAVSPSQSVHVDPVMVEQHTIISTKSRNPSSAVVASSPNRFGFCMNRYLLPCNWLILIGAIEEFSSASSNVALMIMLPLLLSMIIECHVLMLP